MALENFLHNPFGQRICADDIVENLSFFDTWEDRYRYLIDLGKQLPALPQGARTESALVRGCQSQVWLVAQEQDGKLYFLADSDAFIVKGLLAVVLAAYNAQTRAAAVAFDIDDYFAKLELMRHLSPTRGNGLRAMVQRIQQIAASNDRAL
jgi:cysteine desulfuration protein SufE